MNFSWLTTRKVCSVIAHKSKLGGHRVVEKIWCPKNPSFLLSTVCCSVSSSSIPISMRTLSLVHDILCIFLHIHILHALIFFSIFFVIVHVSQPYRTVGKINVLTILFLCLCSRVCLAITFLVQSLLLFLSPPFVLFPYQTSFSTSDPRNVKLVTTSNSSPLPRSCPIIFFFFMLKYRPAFSLSLQPSYQFRPICFFPAINIVSSAYLKLFLLFSLLLLPSICAFLIILSAYRLNKTGTRLFLSPFKSWVICH